MSRFWEIVFCAPFLEPLFFRRHVCLSNLKHAPSRELPLNARKTVFSHLKNIRKIVQHSQTFIDTIAPTILSQFLKEYWLRSWLDFGRERTLRNEGEKRLLTRIPLNEWIHAWLYPASSGFSRPDATLRWERNHCEQPFAFPSSMRVHVMTTNIQRQDGNENFNKTIGLISKTTTLHVHHAFIFAFLCHFCTTTTWRCLILRFMENVNRQRRNLVFFSLLNLEFNSIWVRLHLTK